MTDLTVHGWLRHVRRERFLFYNQVAGDMHMVQE